MDLIIFKISLKFILKENISLEKLLKSVVIYTLSDYDTAYYPNTGDIQLAKSLLKSNTRNIYNVKHNKHSQNYSQTLTNEIYKI